MLNLPGSMLPVSKWELFWLVLAVGMLSANAMAVRATRLYRTDPGTFAEHLQSMLAMLLVYAPTILIFIVMAFNLPPQWNAQAGLVIAAAVLAYLWVQFGGWVRLARLLRLITPADAALADAAAAVARRVNRPVPAVWILHWRKANAFALPFSNSILVTERLRRLLMPEELDAVLAHEQAHLCESGAMRLMRLGMPLLLVPLFTLPLWWPADNLSGPLACYVVLVAGFIVMRRWRRKMEERADSFGNKDAAAGVYPRALEKLYEDNLVPAVMPGRRQVHPHLYDRLLAAGLTPDYPRPRPPGRWGLWLALGLLALNAAALFAVWLLLF
ncbi:MAG: M48 family metalloprotease [Verrucomicrobiota bacterium]